MQNPTQLTPVLVTGSIEEPKQDKVADSPNQQADVKLRYARKMLEASEKEQGSERARLRSEATSRLQEIADAFPGIEAAKKAKELLEGK